MIKISGTHDGHIFHVIYLVGFFFALHMAIPEYIGSSFIGSVASENWVGLFYAAASFISIFALTIIPSLLLRFGNYKVLIATAGIQIIALVGLSVVQHPLATLFFFLIYFTMPVIIFFSLDIILESHSSNEKTGGLRGGYFTILNLAWVVSPFIVSLTLTDSDYWKVFMISAGMMMLVFALVLINFRGFKDPGYTQTPFWGTFKKVMGDKGIRGIFLSNILLQIFYSWMVIYTPIYLHAHLGFEWNEIGVMFGIMLLPFILFEFPAGQLADKRYGEKGILAIGFGIMAVTTAILFFITEPEFILWTVALFATRIGASLVEIMNETYLFKHISGADTGLLGFFRSTRPIAYLIAPVAGTFFLLFISYRALFIVLALMMCAGIGVAFTLRAREKIYSTLKMSQKKNAREPHIPQITPLE